MQEAVAIYSAHVYTKVNLEKIKSIELGSNTTEITG